MIEFGVLHLQATWKYDRWTLFMKGFQKIVNNFTDSNTYNI